MRIAQLTGRSINAGDWLIEERTTALLRHCFPHAQIDVYFRKEVPTYFDNINRADAIIFTGGPLIQELNGAYPLDSYMRFTKPIMLLGVGSKTRDGSIERTYSDYTFSPQTLAFFKKVNDEGFGFGCRDLYTLRVLREKGLNNAIITGCPAWYDLHNVNNTQLRNKKAIKHICISDPWQACYFEQTLSVLTFLKKKIPGCHITFVFHERLNEAFQHKIRLNTPDIDIQYIGGDGQGIHVYDDCDLHIGYRVHAHIYNLSIRNKTILIEEDGRGAGVNEILGLQHITAYKDNIKRRLRTFIPIVKKHYPIDTENYHIIEELAICIDSYETTDYLYLENAFELQLKYFNEMKRFIRRIKELPSAKQRIEKERDMEILRGCVQGRG